MLNRRSGSAAHTLARELNCTLSRAEALEEAILQRHPRIEEHFNSDVGLALQRLDSKMALLFLKEFVSAGRPIITIHDSAIVSVRDTETLKLTMESAYSKVVKNRSREPMTMKGIKVESLDFTACLNALIEKSLDGTLSDDDYKQETWNKSIALNKHTGCSDELYSYEYSEDTDS